MKNSQKSDRIIMIFGLVFMVALVFYLFGSTSEGIYSTAIVKTMRAQSDSEEIGHEVVFDVELEFTSGKYKGEVKPTEHFESPGSAYNLQVSPGDNVLAVVDDQSGFLMVGIDEVFKSYRLMFMTLVVMGTVVLIAGVSGVKALLALCFTLLIIFGVMARMLMAGWPPVPVAIASALLISLINIAFIAGKTQKALIALIGTGSGVILAGVFGAFAAFLLRLTGYTGSESTYLQVLNAEINLQGILISGIIIGAVGAVMDVAISIASSVLELSIANPDYSSKQLFESGMNIGRDIIGSMVNTLILAYTGASLSLIILFSMQRDDFPLIKIMNMEFISSEIVRSLAGLFGMVLAIPVTALVASKIYKPDLAGKDNE